MSSSETTVAQSVSVASPLGEGERMVVRGLKLAPPRSQRNPHPPLSLAKGEAIPARAARFTQIGSALHRARGGSEELVGSHRKVALVEWSLSPLPLSKGRGLRSGVWKLHTQLNQDRPSPSPSPSPLRRERRPMRKQVVVPAPGLLCIAVVIEEVEGCKR